MAETDLHTKVVEFIEACPGILKNVLPSFINPWFTRSENKNLIKKEIPRVIPKSLATLDSFNNSKHMFGEFFAMDVNPPKNAPAKLSDHQAKLALIHVSDRQKPRYGLLEVTLEKEVKTFVFFSLKSVQSQQKSFGDLTNLLRVNLREKLTVNASLVDDKSKIPYVATSVWKTREDPPRKSGADLRNVTEEYKKNCDVIIREWTSRTIEMTKKKDAGIDDAMKRAEEALSRAEGKQKEKETREKSPDPKDKDKDSNKEGFRDFDEPREWKWEPSFKEKLGQVHKVINNNFALGVGYHMVSWEERRFFVLFDTCDVWINGEVLQKLGKTMKDVVSENDHIKFHAVHVDTHNSWNLFYVATAVIVNKTERGARDEDMPKKAIVKESSADMSAAKVNTFKTVAEKLTKKPCPVDPNVEERKALMAKRKEEVEKKRAWEKKRREDERKRLEVERERADRQAVMAAQAAEKKAADRRRQLMTSHPEVLRELQGMEIQRGTSRMYSCKLCGIQAMTLFDAEEHIKAEEHKNLKQKEEGGNKLVSREEAEEALFLNEYKEITPEVFKGRRVYTCKKCKADKLPLEPMKKHVMSVVHKNNHKLGDNFAQLDQECKEMKKKGRNSISYLCTPCGFTSDSVISTKNHIQEPDHKKRTVNYCHACKLFSSSKGKFTEHRFSIAHKRIMADLEKPFEEKEEKEKAAREKRKKERKEAENKEPEPEVPKEPEDPLKCKVCNFEAEDEDEMKMHNKTESHRRKYYLTHGKMPSEDGEAGDDDAEKPFTSLEHMALVHKAKDINDQANKSRSMVIDEDIKKEKNKMIETLFKNNIFEKQTETTIKCTTCEVRLQGHAQQRKLYAQLFVHFTSDKHIQRLRIQVKGEDAAERNQEEVAEVEEDTVADTVDTGAEEESMPLPDPITVSQYQDCTDEEMLDMFRRERDREEEDEDIPVKRMVDLKNKTEQLLYCVPCKTGLMSGKFMARHWDSQPHKDKLPPAPWRSLLDLSSVLEFGNLYKCLYCNSGFMNLRQLETHIMTLDHKDNKDNCLNEDSVFDQNIPIDPPRCDICDKYFSSEVDARCHNLTKLHSIRIDQANSNPVSKFTDNDDVAEKLAAALPAPDLPILPSRLQNQKGRIAGIFESGQFVVIQFTLGDSLIHALFDKSRVANKDKSTFPMVGFPVLFNACKIEAEVAGVSGYVQYWASSVLMADGVRTDSLGTELTYSQLRREEGHIIDMGLEDCKAELKAQLENRMMYGGYSVFFDNHPEYLDDEVGVVTIKTSSCVVIRLQSSGMTALYILEDTSLTELEKQTKEDDLDLQPGTEVHLTGVIMDVNKPAQYLVTSVWKNESIPGVRRDKLQQTAVEMYHTLSLSLPPPQPFLGDVLVPSLDTMDMSGVIDIGQMMTAGLGHDDLAADDSIAADDDDDISEPSSEKPKKGFGIKIASFAS